MEFGRSQNIRDQSVGPLGFLSAFRSRFAASWPIRGQVLPVDQQSRRRRLTEEIAEDSQYADPKYRVGLQLPGKLLLEYCGVGLSRDDRDDVGRVRLSLFSIMASLTGASNVAVSI